MWRTLHAQAINAIKMALIFMLVHIMRTTRRLLPTSTEFEIGIVRVGKKTTSLNLRIYSSQLGQEYFGSE